MKLNVRTHSSMCMHVYADTIYVRAFEDRMDLLRAVTVGASGTPYHDGYSSSTCICRRRTPPSHRWWTIAPSASTWTLTSTPPARCAWASSTPLEAREPRSFGHPRHPASSRSSSPSRALCSLLSPTTTSLRMELMPAHHRAGSTQRAPVQWEHLPPQPPDHAPPPAPATCRLRGVCQRPLS